MTFFVSGKIHSKARPRFTRRGHTYTDPITKAYEAQIKTQYTMSGGRNNGDKPIQLFVEARFAPPKRTAKSIWKRMIERILFPLKRPDIDNVVKVVMDALNKTAYDDDKQVVDLHARKVYAENEGLFIWVDCYE